MPRLCPPERMTAVSVYVTNTTNVVLDIDGYFAPSGGSTLAVLSADAVPRGGHSQRQRSHLGGPYLQGGRQREFPGAEQHLRIPSAASLFVQLHRHSHQRIAGIPDGVAGRSSPSRGLDPEQSYGDHRGQCRNRSGGTDGASRPMPAATPIWRSTSMAILLRPEREDCRCIRRRHAACSTRACGRRIHGKLRRSMCRQRMAPPATAQAYVFNATVLPAGTLGYLTLWADGQAQPVVSTLNAADGGFTSNMAIVPASTNGKIDAYAATE